MKKTQAIIDVLNVVDDLLSYKEEIERLISELESMAGGFPSISENTEEKRDDIMDMLNKLTIR